jgi:hypothetical protein
MWCSASSSIAPASSFSGTSGISIFLMISSRPQIPMTASRDVMPASATACLMAAMTMGGSLMAPSAIVSGASGTTPSALSA